MTETKYIPGVCNIGPEEIAKRRMLGWISLIIALVLFILFVSIHINPWWRLFIFFPAMLSASGFLQAYFNFCSGFARKGIFNFGPSSTSMGQVSTDDSKIKDKVKGNQITLYAVLIGTTIALICVFL